MTRLVLLFSRLFDILSDLSENYSLPAFLRLSSYSSLGAVMATGSSSEDKAIYMLPSCHS